MFKLQKLFDNLLEYSSSSAFVTVRKAANDAMPVPKITFLRSERKYGKPQEWLIGRTHENIQEYASQTQFKGEAHGIERGLAYAEKEIKKLPRARGASCWMVGKKKATRYYTALVICISTAIQNLQIERISSGGAKKCRGNLVSLMFMHLLES
jgi:hypothetical protein